MSTYAITGVGAIGAPLIYRLLDKGHQVLALDNLNDETKTRAEKIRDVERLKKKGSHNFEFAEVDIVHQHERMLKIIREKRPLRMVHTAGLTQDRRSVNHSFDFTMVNMGGTSNFLDCAARTTSVEGVVVLSTRSATGEVSNPNDLVNESTPLEPNNPYGASKGGVEMLCKAAVRNFGKPITVLRLMPQVCDRIDMIPRLLLQKISQGECIDIYGSVDAVRDWLHVEDTIDAILAALEALNGHQLFLVASGVGTTLEKLIEIAEEVVKRKAKYRIIARPPGDTRFGGVGDFSKIEAALGWAPKRNVKEAMEYLFNALVERGEIQVH